MTKALTIKRLTADDSKRNRKIYAGKGRPGGEEERLEQERVEEQASLHEPTMAETEEYEERLTEARDREDKVQQPLNGQKIVWYPQPGSQTTFLQCPIFEALYHGTRGPGKGLRIDQRVVTPEGWSRIDELKVGDQVMGKNGRPCKVTGVYPQATPRPSYRLTFEDCRTIVCDDQHRWVGHYDDEEKTVLLGMQELIFNHHKKRRFFIPLCAPVEWPLANLPTAPYLLGHKLGDELVPDEYLRASPAQRLALLRGLEDTDGTHDAYILGVMQYLVRSLGGKGNRLPEGEGEPMSLLLTRIVELSPAPSICIKVDAEDGLFLTENFIVTHNTDTLLWSFAQHTGQGHGSAWTGILFRQSYPQLADVQAKSEKWFRQVFAGVQFNRTRMVWEWPGGERLLFRHMARPEDYWCVPHGDVLTFDGWKPIQDVKIGDSVLTCNPRSKKLNWQPVATKTEQQYDDELVQHTGRGVHMEMTLDHRVVTNEGELMPYRRLPRVAQLMAGGWWHNQKGLGTFSEQGLRISMRDYCKLMGQWIAGSNGPHTEAWASYLKQFKEKFIPPEILQASAAYQRIFLNAFTDGDFHRKLICQTFSRRLADDLCTLGVMQGYAPYVKHNGKGTSFTITFDPSTIIQVRKKTQIECIHHKGLVYCLGFKKNHTFFIRQKGSVWLSGNSYHGHEYPFIGFEELTNWPMPDCYTSMFACCRSSVMGVPRMVRATTNPYGPGHNWVKARFQLHGRWWETSIVESKEEPARCAIHGHIDENKILLKADPHYKKAVVAAARNPAMAKAWLSGSWDIVAGGIFSDVWSTNHNVVPRFTPPKNWRLDRSFDWGSSSPFSVGWWAESDGSDINIPGKGLVSTVRGDLFRFHEWYGWNGQPNKGCSALAVDVARGIVERELSWELHERVRPGPADSSIYDMENGVSIGTDMVRTLRVGLQTYPGISWTRADKRPGSRIAGWETMRSMIKAAIPVKGRPRENPGLFIMEHCKHFLRTVPILPRDEKNMDDVDTDAEDHIGDETRYRIRSRLNRVTAGKTIGMY